MAIGHPQAVEVTQLVAEVVVEIHMPLTTVLITEVLEEALTEIKPCPRFISEVEGEGVVFKLHRLILTLLPAAEGVELLFSTPAIWKLMVRFRQMAAFLIMK